MRRAVMLLAVVLGAAGAAPEAVLPLQELPPQVLAKNSCALFLWDRATRRRVVMATVQPAMARVMHGGRAIDLAQTSGDGDAVMGFRPRSSFGDGRMTVAFDLAITANEGGGAIVREGVITVTGSDGIAVVSPVAGLVGCV